MVKNGNPAFGAWLRGRIGPRSYGHLATYVGVAPSTISRWVTGESAPEYRNRLKLAQYLDASIEEIDEFFAEPPDSALLHPLGAKGGIVSGDEATPGTEASLLAEVALPLLAGEMTAVELAYLRDFARRVRARRAASAGGAGDDLGRGDPPGGDGAR